MSVKITFTNTKALKVRFRPDILMWEVIAEKPAISVDMSLYDKSLIVKPLPHTCVVTRAGIYDYTKDQFMPLNTYYWTRADVIRGNFNLTNKPDNVFPDDKILWEFFAVILTGMDIKVFNVNYLVNNKDVITLLNSLIIRDVNCMYSIAPKSGYLFVMLDKFNLPPITYKNANYLITRALKVAGEIVHNKYKTEYLETDITKAEYFYLKQATPFVKFIEDNYDITFDERDVINEIDLLKHYKEYCDKLELEPNIDAKLLKKVYDSFTIKTAKSGQFRYLVGIIKKEDNKVMKFDEIIGGEDEQREQLF